MRYTVYENNGTISFYDTKKTQSVTGDLLFESDDWMEARILYWEVTSKISYNAWKARRTYETARSYFD